MDIGKQIIKSKCPGCNGEIEFTLNQVSDEVEIVCSHCGKSIKLTDSNKSSKKSIEDINKAFDDLENTIKKLGSKE